ncbi:hypothetical protein B0H14DRAFT_2657768 [Mycena olivaceomarginata]|nr:hypothetical protein B0H14DRAFT_2657768 [Mycena olivaceomarginata]
MGRYHEPQIAAEPGQADGAVAGGGASGVWSRRWKTHFQEDYRGNRGMSQPESLEPVAQRVSGESDLIEHEGHNSDTQVPRLPVGTLGGPDNKFGDNALRSRDSEIVGSDVGCHETRKKGDLCQMKLADLGIITAFIRVFQLSSHPTKCKRCLDIIDRHQLINGDFRTCPNPAVKARFEMTGAKTLPLSKLDHHDLTSLNRAQMPAGRSNRRLQNLIRTFHLNPLAVTVSPDPYLSDGPGLNYLVTHNLVTDVVAYEQGFIDHPTLLARREIKLGESPDFGQRLCGYRPCKQMYRHEWKAVYTTREQHLVQDETRFARRLRTSTNTQLDSFTAQKYLTECIYPNAPQ